jgi:hypothetical protein
MKKMTTPLTDEEKYSLRQIAKDFLSQVSPFHLAEWLALANSYFYNPKINFSEERKSGIDCLLFSLGFSMLPALIRGRGEARLVEVMEIEIECLFSSFNDLRDIRLAVADIGALFFEEMGRTSSDGEDIERNLKPVVALLSLVAAYINHEVLADRNKKAA